MKKGKLQVKDIPDLPILKFLDDLSKKKLAGILYNNCPQSIYNVFESNKSPAFNLLKAKMRTLIKHKLVEGCACGCRGDFKITNKGREILYGRPSIYISILGVI